MTPTTEGRFRVLDSPRGAEEWLLLDVETFDPAYVPRRGHGDLDDRVAGLRPGYLIEATIEWADEPTITALELRKRTLFTFAEDVTGLFEAARETWADARAVGDAMNVRLTHNTDGEPNAALYVFADRPGGGLLAEFADGERPLEPLIERVNEQRDGDHEVFLLRPEDERFVVVYIVFRKNGLLADTVRDTYDCPRPDEPLE